MRFGGRKNSRIASFFLLPNQPFYKGVLIMAVSSALKLPSLNQLITLAIALVILFLLIGFAPENVKKFFRV